ncbi:hypothetical protein Barb6XT_02870 [Bacteroidales bacterium Barb6XT]|nr:hypothetical protein Barb6XT_02870 [Bacteroidales bacterium Barb6XT]
MKKVILLFATALIFGACNKEEIFSDIPSQEAAEASKAHNYKVVITKIYKASESPFSHDFVVDIATFNDVVEYSFEGTYSTFYFKDREAYDIAIADLDARKISFYFTYPAQLCIMFKKQQPPLEPPLQYEITEN